MKMPTVPLSRSLRFRWKQSGWNSLIARLTGLPLVWPTSFVRFSMQSWKKDRHGTLGAPAQMMTNPELLPETYHSLLQELKQRIRNAHATLWVLMLIVGR